MQIHIVWICIRLSVYITFISIFNQENGESMIVLKSKMIEAHLVLVNNKDAFVVNNIKIVLLYRKRH